MSIASDFYQARAEASAKEAEEATLENVRLRCQRAEAAWRSMADRAIRTELSRRSHEAEKAQTTQ